MDITVLLFITLLIGFIFFYWQFNKKISELQKKQPDQTLQEWLRTMQQSIDTTNRTLHDSLQNNSSSVVRTLQENSKQLNERLDKAAEVIRDVGKEVGQMSEIGR